MKLSGIALAALISVMPVASGAFASAVISSGNVQLGVDDYGQLNIYTPGNPSTTGLTYTGLRHTTTGYEATADGCLCEGWGVGNGANTSDVGYANNATGSAGLSLVSFTSTASTATSVVNAGSSFQVTHEFGPSASADLMSVKVTITNTSASTVADVRYTRNMDWDIEPTAFSEFVTIGGSVGATAVLSTVDDGFGSSDPFSSHFPIVAGGTGDFTNLGPDDHGARFNFGFGALAAGESKTFEIFYGASDSTKTAFLALGAVGAEVYSLANANIRGTPGAETFIFGFKGVGGTPIATPLPGAALLLMTGLGALGALGRRRKAS